MLTASHHHPAGGTRALIAPAECEGHEWARACIEAILAADNHRFELDHEFRAYADGSDRGPRPGAMCRVADCGPWRYFAEHHPRRWVES